MSSWNLILCGHLPSTIVLCVPDPSKWTVSDLKQEVIKHVPKATANDVTLYVGEDEVPEGKQLSECGGVRNGTALLVSIKPFIINVYCPDVDVTVTVEIPLVEFNNWKVSAVLKAVHFKLGMTIPGKDDVLAFNGKSLNDPASSICSIPDIVNCCLMTYTMLNRRSLSTPEGIDNGDFLVPKKVSDGFVHSHCFYNRSMSSGNDWLSVWHIVVQQLDGSQTTLSLPGPHKMTVFSLREAVERVLSVPTHQQKLLLGDSRTVLEDWNLSGSYIPTEMLINNYPSFCDGIKLYLIQLTEGIRVNVSNPQKKLQSLQYFNIHEKKWRHPGYINIHNPSVCTLEHLALIMQEISENCYNKTKIYLDGLTKSVSSSSKPISSVKWITDGCTLTLHEN